MLNLFLFSDNAEIGEFIANFFADYLKDILMWVLGISGGGLVGALIKAIHWFISNNRSKNYYKIFLKEVYGDSTNEITKKYSEFKRYIGHGVYHLTEGNNENTQSKKDDCEHLKYKEFCELLKNGKDENKIIVIAGASGLGKTALMEHLAFDIRKKRSSKKAEKLTDYDIFYRKFGAYHSANINNIIKEFDNAASGNTNHIVFLDAFDETPELMTQNVKEQFKNLLNMFDERTNKFGKVIISVRPEIFEHGIELIQSYNASGKRISIYEVEAFDAAKTVKLYKKISREKREPLSARREHLKIIKEQMNDTENKESVFMYPMVLEWSVDLFEKMPANEFNMDNMYHIIRYIISQSLKREYEIIRKTIPIGEDVFPEIDEYVKTGEAFVRLVAEKMLADNVNTVKLDEISEIRKKTGNDSAEMSDVIKATRNLLRCDSISNDGNKEQYFSFINNLIREAVIADAITDKNYDRKDRFDLLEKYKWTQLPKLYIQAVVDKYPSAFERTKGLPQNIFEIEKLPFSYNCRYVDEIIEFFPNVKSISIGDVDFNETQTEEIIIEHALDLAAKDVYPADIIKCFSQGFISALDLPRYICDTEAVIDLCADMTGLEKLNLISKKFGEANERDFDLVELCKNWRGTSKPILSLDYSKDDMIIPEPIPFGEIRLRFREYMRFSPAYKTVWNARKNGVNIRTISLSHLNEVQECRDPELLEAMYELDSITLSEMNVVNDEVNFSFICLLKLYIAVLGKANDTEKMKEIFGRVLDIIIDKSKRDNQFKIKKAYRYPLDNNPVFKILNIMAHENSDAEYLIGECFWCGYCVEKNRKYAADFYDKSAKHGNAKGQDWLGICYYRGDGVEKDYKKAVELFERSAAQGDSYGQHWLGICYYRGHGVEQDYKKAVDLFERSAAQDNPRGQDWLGFCYYCGDIVEQDYKKAVELFERSAAQDDSTGQYLLGSCYYRGDEVEQDYKKAVELFERSAAQDDSNGQWRLGLCHYFGRGVSRDYLKAVQHFEKSSEGCNVYGEALLGMCYYEGTGVEKNRDKAVALFQQSANTRNQKFVEYYFKGDQPDYDETVRLLKKLADEDDEILW